ncbi:MAG: hypothetical protein HONBIEJF_02373 [Fimbriimonadaceae bacterium]|nr:hypothetical protein [Fimbriimonadaceae bacterium]
MRRAFTLIELLVVIAIIAILAAILFPVFSQAKVASKKTASVSNLRQIGFAIMMYAEDNSGYPQHSSPSWWNPRIRWTDRVFPYAKSEDIFIAPNAPLDIYGKVWAHNQQKKYGGYGFNFQYLGNARELLPLLPFTARDTDVERVAQTVVVADTRGVRRDNGSVSGGEYVIDPPLPSERGSGKTSGYYGDGSECGSGATGCRSTPDERHARRVAIAYADGHAGTMALARMDDFNGDGRPDNGWWNGHADAERR